MSSWLDTKYLGSLAKNAIAEAQKTLDKALDIKDEDEDQYVDQRQVLSTPVKPPTIPDPVVKAGSSSIAKSFSSNLGVSGWGSFTGSFFEAAELGKENNDNQEDNRKASNRRNRKASSERRLVTSSSEPVSLQPTSSSLSKSAETRQDVPEPINPAKSAKTLEPQETHFQQQHHSCSSLMEASCESEILELELSKMEANAKLEIVSNDVISCDLVSVSDSCDDQVSITTADSQPSRVECSVTSSFDERVTSSFDETSPRLNVLESSIEESETNLNLLPVSIVPASLSTVSSVSGLISSMTDDSEELNSSVSSSQTCIPATSSSTTEQELDMTLIQQTIGSTSTITTFDSSCYIAEDDDVRSDVTKLNDVDMSNIEDHSLSACDEPNNVEDSVINRSLMDDALSEKRSSSESNLAFENNLLQTSSQGFDIFMDEKRPESETGSHSSKSFELLKMPGNAGTGKNPVETGSGRTSGNGNGSGHTSGDDLETFTTTSSDIEVISSPGYSEKSGVGPGGPSGGSPISAAKKLKNDVKYFKKGHFRTCSELSSVSCQSDNGDSSEATDRLLKKISELSEILEARETKMVELSRANLELQEQNVDLASQVKEAMKINSKMSEANISSEEFTQRMANLEKKLQQTTAERDLLKEENKVLKKDRISQKDVAKLLAEKDEIIVDLREEGENLSRQAGKHSEIIKKLRTKEKSLEKELNSTKNSLEEKNKECERLKKSLSAKDEVESKQIEAIRELSSANTKWEEVNKKMASDLEDAHDKANGLRLSLETAYKEMGELKRGLMEKEDEAREAQLQKEVEAREKLERQAREDLENFRLERDSLCREIDELRVALSAEERSAARRDEELRRERLELQQRLEQSERRHEELSGSVSSATRPLLRQIESLQASLNETRSNSDRVEQSLSERLQQTSLQLAAAQERDRTASEQYRNLSARAATLESQLNSYIVQKSELEVKLESEGRRLRILEEQRAKEVAVLEALKKSFAEEISELKKEKDILEASLENERSVLVGEQRKNVALVQQLKDRDKRIKDVQTELDLVRSGIDPRYSEKSSPTPSLSQLSIGGSFSEHNWPKGKALINGDVDEVFDSFSGGNGRNSVVMMSGGVYESGRAAGGSMAALLESLQAQLKQREGEIVQLQMEVSGLERVKEGLTQELGRLTQRSDQMQQLQDELQQLRNAYSATEQKYQTMLTMYGEKVEEAEELRLDLLDVKEMYKIQIEEVLKQQH